MNLKKEIMDTMLEIVSVPGISGTESEKLTGNKIYDMLKEFEYFSRFPERLQQVELKDDTLKRSYITALYSGPNKLSKTIILTGHYDVVGIEEFGHLKDLAFSPIEYTKRVMELGLNEDAQKDINTGDWIFGRGTADMKFGLALCIELLRAFTKREDLEGNILFLAVPGEESNSEGMLAAVEGLLELQSKYELNYEALILSECSFPMGLKEEKKQVYLGSCGKVMPLFFAAGKETHVSEPFSGINANLLISEINSLMEVNTKFCQVINGESTPPPMCLKQRDMKELYSVQSPVFAYSYYNLITLKLQGDELIKDLKELALEAFRRSMESITNNGILYQKRTGNYPVIEALEPCILTYQELFHKVMAIYGDSLIYEIKELVHGLENENKCDKQTISVNILKFLYDKYPDKRPMIVIALAPPFYPPKTVTSEDKGLLEAVDDMIAYAQGRYCIDIEKRSYFMGISDLSYTGFKKASFEDIINNIPGLGINYSLPIDFLNKIDIPSIVFGGFGKDFHKYTERLNISFSFDVLPDLYERLINRIL